MSNVNLKMIVPSSVGFLVVVSGICLYFFNSYRKGKGASSEKTETQLDFDDSRCSCCLKPFLINQSVKCNKCSRKFCKNSCGKKDVEDEDWLCLFCYHRRTWLRRNEKWFETFGRVDTEIESENQFSKVEPEVHVTEAGHVAVSSDLDSMLGDCRETYSMENVREIIEGIVEDLVGNVDDTPIDRLYNHPAYDRLFEEFGEQLAGKLANLGISLQMHYANKPDTDTPSMAHTALRELVERAVDEARKLPGLGDSVTTRTQETPSIHEQSYENLLASAILNKVIEKYQRDQVDDNSNVLPEKSRKSRHIRDEFINDVDEVDGSSGLELSSCDEDNNEFNGTRSKLHQAHQEPLSLTIEEEIEEVTTTFTSNQDPAGINNNILNFRNSRRVPFPEYGMDIVDPLQDSSDDSQDETDQSAPMDHITNVESWEENWLFQKKRIPTQSEPVSMLVPNPSADYRALIGDKDAEDTSDLSEFSAQSDEEEEEIDEKLIEAINQVAPQSLKVDQVLQTRERNDSQILNDNFSNEILIEDQTKETHNNNQHEDRNNSDISVTRFVGNVPHQQINEVSVLSEQINKIDGSREFEPYNIKNVASSLDDGEVKEKEDEAEEYKVPIQLPSTPTLHFIRQVKIIPAEFCEPEESNEESIRKDENIDRKLIQQDNLSPHNEILNHDASQETEQFLLMGNEKNQEQTTKNSTTEIADSTKNPESCREAKAQSVSQASKGNLYDEDLELSAPPRPGTIAEREHRKWENAAPIQNNPYSQENIEKRLLERQYSRRSPEVSGHSSVLPTSPSPPLQIVLGASRPDVKRFGRDYYINESKSPAGERLARASTSNSSRPTSSLSQNSTSTGSDFEHQELFKPIETSPQSPELLQNNRETEPNEIMEEILERERKNSKNEINAKLNNQGNFDSIATIFDAKKSFSDDNKRTIRRIDLRAYGFENEFNGSNEDIKTKQQRVVNKLDLRSFGYDAGLRRTQSNNHLDSRVNNHYRNGNSQKTPGKMSEKSNLSQNRSEDFHWTQSTEALNDDKGLVFEKFGKMKSAQSVPNIAKSDTFVYNGNASQFSENEEDDIKPLVVRKIHSPKEINNTIHGHYNYESDSQSSRTESTDELVPKFSRLKELKYSFESLSAEDTFIEKELPMPSVRRLAQAFNKTPEPIPVPTTRITRSFGSKDRPTTPEIQIVKTPRQMHSLTARSLSREFREGLRNISNKPATPTIHTSIIEYSKIPSGANEVDNEDDLCVIKAGKLKNNIMFWEQLHQKN